LILFLRYTTGVLPGYYPGGHPAMLRPFLYIRASCGTTSAENLAKAFGRKRCRAMTLSLKQVNALLIGEALVSKASFSL
jgi:hypothetical protein